MKNTAIGGSIVVFLVIGCGSPRPTLAGGKPVGHWLKALQDPDARVRKTAVIKLGNVGTADEAAFPPILTALKDSDAGVRGEAILAVLKFGPLAKEAIPSLSHLKDHDDDPQIRATAMKALQRLQNEV